jgi:UDP-glucuronate 4-epimerase
MKVLVTGAAGFIGAHVAAALLKRGDEVIGFDNLNDYYDPALKQARLDHLIGDAKNFGFIRGDLTDLDAIDQAFNWGPQKIVHLAAQAGVRYSLQNPQAYVDSNITGTLNILEAARRAGADDKNIKHLVYASSSSVYGGNTKMPFSVGDNVDHPVSIYAATKRANELMAHTYSHLYAIPATGLRFFTVYGPWGRPDMAYFFFTRDILEGRPIDVFNHGHMKRDFTYIDDIVEGIIRVLDRPPTATDNDTAPHRIYNIGNHDPVPLLTFIAAIEKATNKTAELNLLPMQPADVPATYADVDDLMRDTGFAPSTPIEDGIARFVDWYRAYTET